jgi:tetratricopeptide (TPR) repeat protein
MAIFFGIADEKILFIGRELHVTLLLYLAGIVCYYLARFVYAGRDMLSKLEKDEERLSNVYTILASTVFMLVSHYEIQPKLVTLTWAMAAFLLFMIGFFIKDKMFRYCAIALVAVSLLRCVTVDLAGINTGYRIILFICLGLILMAVSFWYARMSGSPKNISAAGGRAARLAAMIITPFISLSVLAAVYLHPSGFRAEDRLKGREIEITARFMAGKSIGDDEAAFLRARKFRNLEKALKSLPLGKDGYNLNIYTRAIDMGLESRDAYNNLGRYYSEKDEKLKAVENYERGIALDPEIKEWDTRYMVRSAAKIYKAIGNYKNAAQYYEKYIAFYRNVEDLYELAICYERLGELNKALEKLNEALRIDQEGVYSGEIKSLRSDIYGKKEMMESKEAGNSATVQK